MPPALVGRGSSIVFASVFFLQQKCTVKEAARHLPSEFRGFGTAEEQLSSPWLFRQNARRQATPVAPSLWSVLQWLRRRNQWGENSSNRHHSYRIDNLSQLLFLTLNVRLKLTKLTRPLRYLNVFRRSSEFWILESCLVVYLVGVKPRQG